MPFTLSRRQITALTILLCVLVIILIAIGYRYRSMLPEISELRDITTNFLNSIPPAIYFVAFIILPAFGFPLTLFYLTAIPVMGTQSAAYGILLAWAAVGLNMTLTYLLARGILHPFIEWVIKHRHLSVPIINRDNEWKIVAAMRLSPIPFFLQNYVLALAKSHWKYYLWISILIQGSIGLAVMLVGESILSGGLGYVLLALFIFLLLNLLFDYIRKRLKRERSQSGN